jgi:hypothetical protein
MRSSTTWWTSPDFEEVQYRVRAIDFDRQSYEGNGLSIWHSASTRTAKVTRLAFSALNRSIDQYVAEGAQMARRAKVVAAGCGALSMRREDIRPREHQWWPRSWTACTAPGFPHFMPVDGRSGPAFLMLGIGGVKLFRHSAIWPQNTFSLLDSMALIANAFRVHPESSRSRASILPRSTGSSTHAAVHPGKENPTHGVAFDTSRRLTGTSGFPAYKAQLKYRRTRGGDPA